MNCRLLGGRTFVYISNITLIVPYVLKNPYTRTLFAFTIHYSVVPGTARNRDAEQYENALSQSYHLMTTFGSHFLLICDFEMKCYKVKDKNDDFITSRFRQEGMKMPQDHVSTKGLKFKGSKKKFTEH